MSEQNKPWSADNLRRYLLLYIAFFIYSITTICAKMAALHKVFSMPFLAYIALEILLLGVYAIIWQQALKQFSLVSAMANKGIVVIFGLLWSVLLFKEVITIYNIIGAVIIISGIWMVSADG